MPWIKEASTYCFFISRSLPTSLICSCDLPRLHTCSYIYLLKVQLLVLLLSNMFPLRGGRVTPYHKSVRDWLLSQDAEGKPQIPRHAFAVNEEVGHALMALASSRLLLGLPLSCEPPPLPAHSSSSEVLLPSADAQPPDNGKEGGLLGKVGGAYALRHAAAHACRPGGSPELVQALLLDLGAWLAVIEAGEC